ncbi:hypothetical protein ACQJBY_050782 [Aegilops geniculata]
MHLFMKQKFSAEKWRNKIVTVGSDEVDLSGRVVGSDLHMKDHLTMCMLHRMELHPSSCARTKEGYTRSSLRHECIVAKMHTLKSLIGLIKVQNQLYQDVQFTSQFFQVKIPKPIAPTILEKIRTPTRPQDIGVVHPL